MARKSCLATLLGVAAFAVPNATADQGGIPHDGSNGHGRPAVQTQAQAQVQVHAKAKAKALAKGHAKVHAKSQATVHGKALAKGHAKVHVTGQAKVNGQAQVAPSSHAKAGKTTICHATGSTKNPYVTITISNNAIPAHRRHQDGRDIIPAPAGGCPTAAAQQPAGHPQGQTKPAAGTTPSNASVTAQSGPAASNQGVLGESTSGSSKAPNNKVSVLGATTSGKAPSASSSPSATATRPSSSRGLPFTGTDAIIVAILGLAALLIGVTVRRLTTNRVEI